MRKSRFYSIITVLIFGVLLTSCEPTRYKTTLYVKKSPEYSEQIISAVSSKMNSDGRNVFSYKIQTNILSEKQTYHITNNITGIEITSHSPYYLPAVKIAFLQEIYLREKGPIPSHSIQPKSIENFILLNIFFPGLSLISAIEDNIAYQLNSDTTKFLDADGISLSFINKTLEMTSILTLSCLIECFDKLVISHFLLKSLTENSFNITIPEYFVIIIAITLRLSSLFGGLELIHTHNNIVSSGYNLDPNFPTSKLFKEDEYPLFEVRLFKITF